jgi:hypothetical protein
MVNSAQSPFYQKTVRPYLQTLQQWAKLPLFHYLMLFLLELRVMWGVWQYRDLTSGDTSSYFSLAYLWFKDFKVDIIWSPLYTAFYGTLLHFSSDAYVVTILHRLIIVFILTVMVLALMRRLLPPDIAWLVSAWWAVVPNNFDVFEVHLFAVIPVLAAWLLILYKPSPWTRGGAIAILLAASVVTRNELIVATGILTMVCICWEIWLAKNTKSVSSPKLRVYLIAYGLPLLLAGLLSLFFYTRSIVQFPQLPAAGAPKHTVNMCQVYTFGYKQRHPEFNKDHWTQCDELMMAQFGKKLPSLPEMIQTNPAAVLEHVLWNVRLTPNGIQVSLFGATSGAVSPDYIPVGSRSSVALVLSVITGAILVLGSFLLYWKRHYWWTYWLRDRALGWLAMLAILTVVVFIIIPTQRPRPEYLYGLSIFLMALTGMSVAVIAHHWPALKRLSGWMPIIMLMVLLTVPGYYANPKRIQPRRLLELYQRLVPFQNVIARPNTVFLKGEYAFDVSGYIGHRVSQVLDYRVLDEAPADIPLEVFLDKRGINLFYVDGNLWSRLQANPLYRTFLASPESGGWKLIAFQDSGDANKWMLFQKMSDLTNVGREPFKGKFRMSHQTSLLVWEPTASYLSTRPLI